MKYNKNEALNKALIEASSKGNIEVVKLLIEAGAEITSESLKRASRFGHFDIVELLVNASINQKMER